MTAQWAGGRSRGEFLRKVTLVGAVDVFGVFPRSLAAVEEIQTGVQTHKPSALGDTHSGTPMLTSDVPTVVKTGTKRGESACHHRSGSH
jgi:hypothetical protein